MSDGTCGQSEMWVPNQARLRCSLSLIFPLNFKILWQYVPIQLPLQLLVFCQA